MSDWCQVGRRVVIRFNPHHAAAENVVGLVTAVRVGEGFFGTDLIEVEYQDPRDGTVHVMLFGTANLSPGEPAALIEIAERHEAIAAELRRMAKP